MDITTGIAVAKTAVDLMKNENVLNKSVGMMGMLFPFAGLKQKAVETYVEDIEKSDLPAETKVFMILNTKKTFQKDKKSKNYCRNCNGKCETRNGFFRGFGCE